ncbi:hypothetical protein GCM10027399_09040 [Curvibacter fontanus]
MSRSRTPVPDYQRQTYHLQGSHSSNPAKLDYGSHLRAHWAAKWVQLQGSLKTPLSGIIRRALQVYVAHLEQLPPDMATSEVRSVKTACHGTHTPPDEQEAAEARLGASSGVLPPFDVVLLGAYQVAARTALHKHLEQFNHIPAKKEPKP